MFLPLGFKFMYVLIHPKKWLLDKIKPVTENSNNAVRRSTRLASRNITPADPDAANTGVYLHSYTQENFYCNFDP